MVAMVDLIADVPIVHSAVVFAVKQLEEIPPCLIIFRVIGVDPVRQLFVYLVKQERRLFGIRLYVATLRDIEQKKRFKMKSKK